MTGIPQPLDSLSTGILQDMALDPDYQANTEYLAEIQEALRERGERVPGVDSVEEEDDFGETNDPITEVSRSEIVGRGLAGQRRREPPAPAELPCGHPVSDLEWDGKRTKTHCRSCKALERATKAIAKGDEATKKRALKALRGWRPPA